MTRDAEPVLVRDPDPVTLGIGELAAMFKITTRAIRFYEARSLLAPRRVGKTRIYGDRDCVRLELILRGKRLGFSLARIKAWLDLYGLEDGEVRQYEALLCESRKRIADLERQLDDLVQTLGELKDMEAIALTGLAEAGAAGRRSARDGLSARSRRPRRSAAGQKG